MPTGPLQPSAQTPATGAAPRGWPPLPPALVSDGASRVAWLAGVSAAFIVIVEVAHKWLQPAMAPVYADPVNRLLALAAVLMAAGLVALRRTRAVTGTALLALVAPFQILVAFVIAMAETTRPFDTSVPQLGISTVGAWILVSSAFIPNRPIWTVLVALASASMWPIAFATNTARFDYTMPPLPQLAVWPGINFLLAGLAYPIAHRLYGAAIATERASDFGSYRLVAPIGQGGMGEVWTATHRMLARRAAIKLVRPDGLSARQAEIVAKRFRREANAIAGLQSPHTIYLYDFGTSDDGRFYYVMELVDGISLQTLVQTFGPQPAPRVAAILAQICDSLEEAHRQGLVHRDLKPSNIMICKVALAHDVVKVLDFGLAKSITGADEGTQLTMEGAASGTPGYIAPEVSTGDHAVDHRADIYALGCVAYWLLTGTLVFEEAGPVAMALKHVQAEPDPPSLRTELPIPPMLERLVLDCLAKRPADRPASAREIAARLAACQLPPWTAAEANTWWERHLPPTSSLRSFADTDARTPALVRKQ